MLRGLPLPLLLCALLVACGAPSAARTPSVPPLDHARHGHRLHQIGDLVICVGGFGDPHAVDRGTRATWLLDLAQEEPAWTRGADLRTGKTFFGSDVVDGRVVAVGRGGIERFDPAHRQWEALSDGAAFPDTHLAAVAVGGVVHVLGGYPAERGQVRGFDLANGQQVDVAPLPGQQPGDHFHVAVLLDGALHVVGGLVAAGAEPSTQHWRLDRGIWRARAPAPHAVWAKFAAYGVIGGSLYLFTEAGGLCYDPTADTWTARAPMPVEWLAMPGSLVLGSRLHVLGGHLSGGASAGAGHVYDSRTNSWETR
jgi:hypothetical protein